MALYLTRRNFLSTCIGGLLLTAADLRAHTADIPIASMPFREPPARSTVALVTGPERRTNVTTTGGDASNRLVARRLPDVSGRFARSVGNST